MWVYVILLALQYYIQPYLMRSNKFQEIITNAINKLKPTLTTEQHAHFESQLTLIPKKLKQFNAEPYLFIFDLLLTKRQLIEYSLQCLTTMLQQNYITYPMYDRLSDMFVPLVKDHSYNVILALMKIKEPHLELMRLYFQIYSNVALPEDTLRKYKSVGYKWLIRAFNLKYRPLALFQAGIYNRFYPDEIPKLMTPQEQQEEYKNYIGLTLKQMLMQVQFNLSSKQKRGKYGFCFICGNIAEYYCKDTKISVCNVECKKKHLDILNKNIALHEQYPLSFQLEVQSILIDNLECRRSPALNIDFLIAIYTYSNFKPVKSLPHQKIFALPVIFQRIWMLYLSYYGKKGQYFQHIFAYCLKVEHDFTRDMASSYFLLLASDSRFFEVYYSFDRIGDFRLTDFVLRSLESNKRKEFIKSITRNIFQNYHQNNIVHQNNQSSLLRIFNHQKSLTSENLAQHFHTNPQQTLITLIIRNELSINKQKLGQFLYSNESILKLFLSTLSAKLHDAPIDELLREIFYFINVKISDKIYRLIELLGQVYEYQLPFDQNSFFTYCYFIIMVVTEFNTSHLNQTKPTIESVISRVQHFSPLLAKEYRSNIQGMYQRISNYSFSQQSRGILSHYPPHPYTHPLHFNPEQIIIQNHEIFYEIIIASNPQVDILHKICVLAINHPVICQPFLQLLVDKLTDQNRDGFLIGAISNVIERQPNAAGYLWREILEERFSSFHVQGGQNSLRVSNIIECTPLLTEANFKQFTRQFTHLFLMTDHIPLYILFIQLNLSRLPSITQFLTLNAQKCKNDYLKLSLIKKLTHQLTIIIQCQSQSNKLPLQKLLLTILKDIALTSINECLFVQCILSIDKMVLHKHQQFWNILIDKCFRVKNERPLSILEQYIKLHHGERYQEYLIQKTLKTHQQIHINLEIVEHLDQLEPFLPHLHREVRASFILNTNLPSILKHFEYFYTYNQTYSLLHSSITNHDHVLSLQHQQVILKYITRLIHDKDIILDLQDVPKVLILLLQLQVSSSSIPQSSYIHCLPIIIQYLHLFTHQPSSSQKDDYDDIKIKKMIKQNIHLSILIEEMLRYVIQIQETVKGNQRLDHSVYKRLFQQLHAVMLLLYYRLRSFSDNIDLRMKIHRFMKSNMIDCHFPSSLNNELKLLKCIFLMEDIRHHPNEPSFMLLLSHSEKVIQKQQQVTLSFFSSPNNKNQALFKLKLQESNKDALAYSELMIDIADSYVRQGGELNLSDGDILKGMLVNILMHGWYKQDSSMFHSLAGSNIASKISSLFALLK